MKLQKITVASHENKLITVSKKSPDYGVVRFETTERKFGKSNWANGRKRVAFVRDTVENWEEFLKEEGITQGGMLVENTEESPLRIVVKESNSPFYEGQKPKIRPEYVDNNDVVHPEEEILVNGNNVYRQTHLETDSGSEDWKDTFVTEGVNTTEKEEEVLPATSEEAFQEPAKVKVEVPE